MNPHNCLCSITLYIILTTMKWLLLGTYKLESDAALVADMANAEFHNGRRNNFLLENEYYAARTQEMLVRGLALNDVGTVESIKEKAAAKIAKIHQEKPS